MDLSYLCIKPHLKILRLCGICPLSKESTKLQKIIHTIYMRIILFSTLMIITQEIVHIYQVRHDAYKVTETLYLLLTYSDYLFKIIVVWKKFNQIEALIEIMRGPIFNKNQIAYNSLLIQTNRSTKLFLRWFNAMSMITSLLWALYPITLHYQGKHVEFTSWLPFGTSTDANFFAAVLYQWLQTSWLAYNNTTIDALVATLLVQSKTQLSILKLELEGMVSQSKKEAKELSITYTKALRLKFRKILSHYNEIIDFTNLIQSIFSGVLLYQFLVSGWIICTIAYSAVKMNRLSLDFLSMITYMMCIVTELFLFCYMGHEVTWESGVVYQSAYNMDWLEIPLSLRRDLMIFMERIKRPIAPVAGSLIPLSNTTFLSIMRSSYSFYVFLKNTD